MVHTAHDDNPVVFRVGMLSSAATSDRQDDTLKERIQKTLIIARDDCLLVYMRTEPVSKDELLKFATDGPRDRRRNRN